MVGEKYLTSDHYDSGQHYDGGDNENQYTGVNIDQTRVTFPGHPYLQDRPGLGNKVGFGSPHAAGGQFVLCDGAVRTISYQIDEETHRRLGSRMDHLPIDLDSF